MCIFTLLKQLFPDFSEFYLAFLTNNVSTELLDSNVHLVTVLHDRMTYSMLYTHGWINFNLQFTGFNLTCQFERVFGKKLHIISLHFLHSEQSFCSMGWKLLMACHPIFRQLSQLFLSLFSIFFPEWKEFYIKKVIDFSTLSSAIFYSRKVSF